MCIARSASKQRILSSPRLVNKLHLILPRLITNGIRLCLTTDGQQLTVVSQMKPYSCRQLIYKVTIRFISRVISNNGINIKSHHSNNIRSCYPIFIPYDRAFEIPEHQFSAFPSSDAQQRKVGHRNYQYQNAKFGHQR